MDGQVLQGMWPSKVLFRPNQISTACNQVSFKSASPFVEHEVDVILEEYKSFILNQHNMKRISFAIIFTCCTLAIAAQKFEYPEYPDDEERIAVKYQGSRPTIVDFATAYLNHSKEIEFFGKVNDEWLRFQKKQPLSRHVSIDVDIKNGYMRYEILNPEEKDTTVMEMCFWNCADGKHKLVCANKIWMMNDDYGWDEHIGPSFFVYDNTKREMRTVFAEDIGALYDGDGLSVFFLPRKGKDIKVSAAGGGERWNEVLEWNGFTFNSRKLP